MYSTRLSSAFIRALLVVPLALAFSACTYPEALGEGQATGDTDDGTGSSDATTAASQGTSPEPLTTTTTDGTGVITTTSTGVVTEPATSGNSDTDDSATDASATDASATDDSATTDTPGLPAGMCWSEFHEEYWCECMDSNTQACGDDGISLCFAQDDFVVTHMKWGPCGACAPGQQIACDIEGAPGRQFCDVDDAWVDDIENLPTPAWGTCLLEEDIVCEPGQTKTCPDDISSQSCVVDEQGVPHWTDC